MTSIKEKYKKEIIPLMKEKFNYKNNMAVPKIEKVVVNVGFGRLVAGKTSGERKKVLGTTLNDLALITGQQSVLTKARKSISGFKIRQGVPIGAMITLRRKRMFNFLERLIHVALPRSRDFTGIKPESFDKNGNLTIAIKEHISFPEILPEEIKRIFSFEITIVTTAKKKEEGLELLRLTGFPIKKD
ncbi:MAG: 50S ribosomal protein L5 [Patescibacteria group bacterium]|nr:50S ribosomal protein L5 [Patescibacteria group bacterium]